MMKRSTPLFHGPLATQFEAFLVYRGALGSAHAHVLVVLCHLDHFLLHNAPSAAGLDPDLLHLWLRTLEGRKAQTVGNYQRVARQFCEYRCRFEPKGYVPEKWPLRPDPSFRPYIFSETEIAALLASAAKLRGDLRPHTIRLLILLLYTAGLRISEPLRLRLKDYDRATTTLRIERSKFGKSRFVPLAATVAAEVDAYLLRRQAAGLPTDAEAPLLINTRRQSYSVVSVQHIITRLLREVCQKPLAGRGGPRVHDLRHTMACHRLLRWYRAGLDVQAKLPLLATYMGHRNYAQTQVYLTPTAELLSEANSRFHSVGQPVVARQGVHVDA
jgi:integrase